MSYPDNPPLSAVGGGGKYTQYVVPTFEIPPEYEKITPAQRQILEFAKNGNAKGIRKMAANQPRNRIKSEIIDCTDELGWTPIMWAIEGGHAECISALYEAGADTNKRSSHSIFSGSDVEYELNSLMYATLLAAEDRIGIECVEALLKRRRAQEQTERNYIVEITFESGVVVKSSALTFVIHMANQQLRPVHLPLIKLLLDNRVNIQDDDFIQFNIQRPGVLKLLLDRLRYDTLYVVTDLDDLPFLPNLIKLKHTPRYKPVDSEKRKESARLLLDFYTSEELVKRREELGAEPEKEEAAAPVLFWHAIRYKVPEFVEQCIEENIPFVKGNPIYMSGSNVGRPGWDILRKVLAYREQRGENIKLSEKLIAKITRDKEFLLQKDIDLDVLTGFGVPDNICEWGSDSDTNHRYRYQSKIPRVLPKNLDFAIKHGFDPGLWGPILVHVHNQTEFTKAFVFMKTTPIIIDLGGGEYHLPKTDIDVAQPGIYEEINDPDFVIICAAQDTGGEAAAGPIFDAANPTYIQVVDENHQISSAFNFVNVPSAAWIDEEGRIVRIDEGTYAKIHAIGEGEQAITFGNDVYEPALKDWVANGADSVHVQSAATVAGNIRQHSKEQEQADAAFCLGNFKFFLFSFCHDLLPITDGL